MAYLGSFCFTGVVCLQGFKFTDWVDDLTQIWVKFNLKSNLALAEFRNALILQLKRSQLKLKGFSSQILFNVKIL